MWTTDEEIMRSLTLSLFFSSFSIFFNFLVYDHALSVSLSVCLLLSLCLLLSSSRIFILSPFLSHAIFLLIMTLSLSFFFSWFWFISDVGVTLIFTIYHLILPPSLMLSLFVWHICSRYVTISQSLFFFIPSFFLSIHFYSRYITLFLSLSLRLSQNTRIQPEYVQYDPLCTFK